MAIFRSARDAELFFSHSKDAVWDFLDEDVAPLAAN
jgi:hypothetical protein